MTDTSTAYRLLIGGEWVAAGDGTYDDRQPGDRGGRGPGAERLGRRRRGGAAAAAEAAFPAWSRTTPEERAELLRRPPTCSTSATTSWCRWCRPRPAPPCGSPRPCRCPRPRPASAATPRHRVESSTSRCRRRSCRPPRSRPAGSSAASSTAPRSAWSACITSYNFPITNMAGKIGPALAMGNTVVVKPAPQDPLGVIRMCELFDEAGFPPGVVNVVVGAALRAGRGARRLARRRHGQLHRLDRGRAAHRRGRRHASMKRLLLELGGKGAAIVFDDADLKTAIGGIASACGASTPARSAPRPPGCIAQRGVYDQLVAGLAGMAAAPEGRRPARARHRRRPGHHRRAPRPRRGLRRARPSTRARTVVAGGERPDLDTRLLRRAHAPRRLPRPT